jgi:hypothetical protein
MKNHNIFYRELAEIKSAFASAITPENAIILCRSLQRDCLHSKDRDKDQAWERLFKLLDILGLKSVSPDLVKADEVKVYRANPPSLVERAMRQERTATSSSIIESKTPVV